MKKDITPAGIVAAGVETAWENAAAIFERFCLAAGVATPRAYWLKAGNADLPISTDSGTSPTIARKVIYFRVSSKE